MNWLGFLFVQRWTAWWWIVWGFCLSSGKQPDGELFEVSVCPVTVVNCLSGGELPNGELSGVFLSVQWWTAQRWTVWCICWQVVNCLVVKCPLVNYPKVKCPALICCWDCHSCMGLFSQCCNTTWTAQSTNEFQSSDARCLYYLLLLLAVEGTTGMAYWCRWLQCQVDLEQTGRSTASLHEHFLPVLVQTKILQSAFIFCFPLFSCGGRSEGTILRSPAWLFFEVDFWNSTSSLC